jgi:hypothetical protein
MRTEPTRALNRMDSDEWRGSAAFRFELLREEYDQTVELASEAADRLHAVESRNDDDDEYP